MISHKYYNVVLEMGSLKVYYLWESPHESVPITQNFYWHDKKCQESIGPFVSLAEAMQDYAATKRTEKLYKGVASVQQLQSNEPRKIGCSPALGMPYGNYDDGFGTEPNQDKAPPDFVTRRRR
jgi:hypothetical protein